MHISKGLIYHQHIKNIILTKKSLFKSLKLNGISDMLFILNYFVVKFDFSKPSIAIEI